MKTDYTITTEYHLAMSQQERLDRLAFYAYGLQNSVGRETPEQLARMQHGMTNINPWSGQMSAQASQEAEGWLNAYDEARRSHAAGEPLIRTVCKIATRILFVLLVVGVAVMVMV